MVNFGNLGKEMKRLHLLTGLIFCVVLSSCKREEDLTIEKDIAASQQAGIDFLNEGGEADLGEDNLNEFLTLKENGTNQTFSSFTYSENGSILTFSGIKSSTTIGFNIIGIPKSGDTIKLDDPLEGSVTYVQNTGDAYTSIDGELIVETSNSTYISGSFFFDAQNAAEDDTIAIRSGSYKIAK